MNPERSGVDLKTIRGDYKDDNGTTQNRLRRWELDDFMPRPGDIYQERLYAIQWVTKASIGKGREKFFFTAVTGDDLKREQIVADLVRNNLAEWQRQGLVPDLMKSPHFCATLKSPTLGFPRAAGWRIIREGELCARRRNDLISFMNS